MSIKYKDTKGVIRNRNSKNNRQYNGRTKKYKKEKQRSTNHYTVNYFITAFEAHFTRMIFNKIQDLVYYVFLPFNLKVINVMGYINRRNYWGFFAINIIPLKYIFHTRIFSAIFDLYFVSR